MKRKIIPFTTQEEWLNNRKQDLTSTDIPDLFGCGYSNYQELFNRKLNNLESSFIPNERSSWGNALEPCIATEFARLNKWTIRKKSEYIRIPDIRLGSSFDYEGIGEIYRGEFLIEVKNVGVDAYKRDWIKGFEIEAPPRIELQIQNELLVSGLSNCFLCVLIGGNQGMKLIRQVNNKIREAILIKVYRFWKEIDEAR